MAAPTPTVPVAPAGIKLDDGYRSRYVFAADTDVSLWPKTVKPIGIDGGDPINTTTMLNDDAETTAPQALVKTTAGSMKCAYDPDFYNQALALVNVKTTITQVWPDGSTLAFYGYLRLFDPDELQRGTQPEANVGIESTNWDHVNKVEAFPVLTSVAGT